MNTYYVKLERGERRREKPALDICFATDKEVMFSLFAQLAFVMSNWLAAAYYLRCMRLRGKGN